MIHPDPLEATQLFETALEKRTRLGPEASLMLESELGLLWLRAGKMAEAKAVVESGKTAVEELQVSFPECFACCSRARFFFRLSGIVFAVVYTHPRTFVCYDSCPEVSVVMQVVESPGLIFVMNARHRIVWCSSSVCNIPPPPLP